MLNAQAFFLSSLPKQYSMKTICMAFTLCLDKYSGGDLSYVGGHEQVICKNYIPFSKGLEHLPILLKREGKGCWNLYTPVTKEGLYSSF